MATTDKVLKARVERGAALLDAEQPGWAPRIDVPTLDMTSGFDCTLGQLYNGFWRGIDALSIKGWRHGFVTTATTQAAADEDHDRLLPLWREAIEARTGTEAT